jgi:hypothetical protein
MNNTIPIAFQVSVTAQEFVNQPATIKRILDHIGEIALREEGFKVGRSLIVPFTADGKELVVTLDSREDGWHAMICTPEEERELFVPNRSITDGQHRTQGG